MEINRKCLFVLMSTIVVKSPLNHVFNVKPKLWLSYMTQNIEFVKKSWILFRIYEYTIFSFNYGPTRDVATARDFLKQRDSTG